MQASCALTALITIQAGAEMPDLQAQQLAFGEALFFDVSLSRNRDVSCASCHDPEHAFADDRPQSLGTRAQPGARNAPSLVGVGLRSALHWDGRATTLEAQLVIPLFSPSEMGMSGPPAILERINGDPSYAKRFPAVADPSTLRFEGVVAALVHFQRQLSPQPLPVDRYLIGEEAALSREQRLGWDVFNGKGECHVCHTVQGPRPNFSDSAFHVTGIGFEPLDGQLQALAMALSQQTPEQRLAQINTNPAVAALGRFVVTLQPQDIGRFATPPLRSVALTAPYMHDGSVATLEAAVDLELYYRGRQLGYPILLTSVERRALLAFMATLADPGPELDLRDTAVRSHSLTGNGVVASPLRLHFH